jgi:hypothetical protein
VPLVAANARKVHSVPSNNLLVCATSVHLRSILRVDIIFKFFLDVPFQIEDCVFVALAHSNVATFAVEDVPYID